MRRAASETAVVYSTEDELSKDETQTETGPVLTSPNARRPAHVVPSTSALLCGIKISAVHHLELSQSTRVTDRQTDGQNYDPKTVLAHARTVKMCTQYIFLLDRLVDAMSECTKCYVEWKITLQQCHRSV